MDTIPWPPERNDIRAGVVFGALAAGADGAVLRVRLAGGAEACTLVDEPRWSIGDRVLVHYERMLDGAAQILRVRRC